MLCLQFTIGIANDLADASSDALAKPDKPLPAGLLTSRQAGVALLATGAAGLASAASVGVPALAVGVLGLADGLLYDLRLKGTAISWAPFAAGVGLLPYTDGGAPPAPGPQLSGVLRPWPSWLV